MIGVFKLNLQYSKTADHLLSELAVLQISYCSVYSVETINHHADSIICLEILQFGLPLTKAKSDAGTYVTTMAHGEILIRLDELSTNYSHEVKCPGHHRHHVISN